MTVDVSAIPPHIGVAVGERIEIDLPTYLGSGNEWSTSTEGDDRVARAAIEIIPPEPTSEGEGTREPPEIALAQERLVVTGLTPGTTTVHLVLGRPFDARVAASTRLEVNVSSPGPRDDA